MSNTNTAVQADTNAAFATNELRLDAVNKHLDSAGKSLTQSQGLIQSCLQIVEYGITQGEIQASADLLAHVVGVTADWHGLNTSKLRGYIAHHAQEFRIQFSKKEGKFIAVIQKQTKKSDGYAFPVSNASPWFEFTPDNGKDAGAKQTAEDKVYNLLVKMIKDGKSPETLRDELKEMLVRAERAVESDIKF